jgi:purine nucleoside permease
MQVPFARRLVSRICIAFALVGVCAAPSVPQAASVPSPRPIGVKVVVVAMFEVGEDTGDTPGEYQLWVEREHLDRVIELPAGFHHARINGDGVLAMLTGVGTARAASSVMAVGLDPRFDLSHAYWIIAGIGGGDPANVSLGSAVWADHVIDGDLAYEIDAREIPKQWPTGMVPLNHATPYEPPARQNGGEIYTLNPQLVGWAYQITKDVALADTDRIRTARAHYSGFVNAQKPPFVTHGDDLSGSTFWHGTLMNRWASAWDAYFTGGSGKFMVTAMEDTGTMQALTFLAQAGRIDLHRVLVLRTVSNFTREAPGERPADSLKRMAAGDYPAFRESVEAAEAVGDKVVRDIIDHWGAREASIPGAP